MEIDPETVTIPEARLILCNENGSPNVIFNIDENDNIGIVGINQ